MFLEKISWVQAQEYFEKKDIAIIPVGSTENHGSQLCLGTDFLIPRKLCEMMDERLDVLIVPTIPYGVGDQHANFPGTITIGADGLYDLVTRIVNETLTTSMLSALCSTGGPSQATSIRSGKAVTAAAKRQLPC